MREREWHVEDWAAGGEAVLRPIDDLLLHLRVQVLEVRGITGHAHQQLVILTGVLDCLYKIPVRSNVELNLHAPGWLFFGRIEITFDVGNKPVKRFLRVSAVRRKLEVHRHAIVGEW